MANWWQTLVTLIVLVVLSLGLELTGQKSKPTPTPIAAGDVFESLKRIEDKVDRLEQTVGHLDEQNHKDMDLVIDRLEQTAEHLDAQVHQIGEALKPKP